MRVFRATPLLACVSAAAIACALASRRADAHTVSIGYAFVSPGSVSIWYGSYHGSSTFNEADVQLTGPSYNQTILFTLLANSKPAGLIDGVTNFYSNTAGTALVGTPQQVSSTDGSGGSFNPATQSILHWQGAIFSGLRPGTYTFTYNPLSTPTVEWHPINDVIRTNSFTLTAFDILGIPGFTSYANTQNQYSVANGMDVAINNGGYNQKFYDIAALPPAGISNALKQLGGETHTQAGQAGFQSMNAFLTTMLDPWSGAGSIDGARSGDFGSAAFPGGGVMPGDASSLYSNSPYGTAPYGSSPYGSAPYGSSPYGNSPYGNSPYGNAPYGNSPYGNAQNGNGRAASIIDPRCTPTPNVRYQPCWSVWVTPYGGYSSMNGSSFTGSHDTTVKSGGMISGVDYRFGQGGVVGAAIAAGTTSWGLSDSLGGGRSDSFQAGAYASQRFNTLYVSAAMAFGWQQVSTNRTVTISGSDQFSADFSSKGFGARAEIGNRFEYQNTGLTPYGAVQFQTWRLPGYSETTTSGAPDFAVSIDARNANNTRFEAGLWFDRAVDTQYGRLQLRGRMAWLNEMRSPALINAAFPALPGSNFTVTGASGDPNALLISYGAELRVAGGWSVGAKFDGELAAHSQTYAGTGTVRYRW